MGVRLEDHDAIINRRNTIIHQYDDFTERAIWRHIKKDLPKVKTEVLELLEEPETP